MNEEFMLSVQDTNEEALSAKMYTNDKVVLQFERDIFQILMLSSLHFLREIEIS